MNVLITGAGSGIGLATAKRLHDAGWRVFAGVLPAEATDTLTPITTAVLPFDITQPEQIQTTYEHIAEATEGALHGLVNSAGINLPGTLETMPISGVRRVFEVNLFGHLQVTQAMLPLLRAARGRVVNVSSIMGRVAMPTLGAYSMSKHALEAMTDVLRLELAPFGVAVVSVQPGAVQTPMTDGMSAALDAAFAQLDADAQARYGRLFEDMKQALGRQAGNATAAEAIAEAIYHALSAKQPKTRYAIGAAAAGLLLMRRMAPDAVADGILRRALSLTFKD